MSGSLLTVNFDLLKTEIKLNCLDVLGGANFCNLVKLHDTREEEAKARGNSLRITKENSTGDHNHQVGTANAIKLRIFMCAK